jgi:hypothetical protein
MGSGTDSLLEAALELPEKERARVAKELIATLDEQWDEGADEACVGPRVRLEYQGLRL